jgi:hypothetical protein
LNEGQNKHKCFPLDSNVERHGKNTWIKRRKESKINKRAEHTASNTASKRENKENKKNTER